jgi:nucleoside 2-deoxyribosyltransferase
MRVYWANSIFSLADHNFNEMCIAQLRQAGHHVFNPQEKSFNTESISEPTSAMIFDADTKEILDSDVLVACIDQESIDSGVACEIGIGWHAKKKIVGLYTDFRRNRKGEGRMYKNLYVLGCICSSGGSVVGSLQEVLEILGS